jgi:outer membrane biosynthesis protein TonB
MTRENLKKLRSVVEAGVLVLTVSVGTWGCARAQARTTPVGPPLDVPAPPPRDVEPAATEAPATPTPAAPATPQEPPRSAPPRPRPAPPREQPRDNRPEPSRTEPPKPEASVPDNEAARPAGTLQTKPTGEEGDVERGIRATLTHANADLGRVDYRKLNTDARAQYDYAKRFISQAEDALRAKNLVFAKTVADKAAALAAQLAGR